MVLLCKEHAGFHPQNLHKHALDQASSSTLAYACSQYTGMLDLASPVVHTSTQMQTCTLPRQTTGHLCMRVLSTRLSSITHV